MPHRAAGPAWLPPFALLLALLLPAGAALAGTGTSTSTIDVFVARYTDAGTGLANGGAVSGGGTGNDIGYGIAAVSSGGTASVYVTGYFVSGTGASIAGTALAGTSSTDLFVARYTDAGTGLADGGAISGGGTGADVGNGIAAAGGAVYVGGYIVPAATFGSIGLG